MASKGWPSWSFAKTFFIYDHDIVQREEDDPKLAVVYFHPQPPLVSEDMQCLFCGQVMAMVSFLNTLVGCKPRLYRLKRMKIATVHAGRFTMAMASSINTPDEIAVQKLQNLFGLFNFFHGSIKRIFKEYGSDHDAFVNHVATIVPSYLSFVHYHDNKVRESFQDIPMVQLPKGSHLVYLKASHLLQWLKRRPKLLGGCILYKHKVLCTQLSPGVTRYLLVVKSKQHHLPAITLSLEFELPVGVKILAAFLTEEEYSMFGKVPPSEKVRTLGEEEGASQASGNAKEYDSPSGNSIKVEKEKLKNDRKEQRSFMGDFNGRTKPARQDKIIKQLQFTFESNQDDNSKMVDNRNDQDTTRIDGSPGTGEKYYSQGGSCRREISASEENKEKTFRKEYGSDEDRLNLICKDGMTGEYGSTCQDGTDQDEIHGSDPEKRFGKFGGEDLPNEDLGSSLEVNAKSSVRLEDPDGSSFTKVQSSEAESSCSERKGSESDDQQERMARKLVWDEESTEDEPHDGEIGICNVGQEGLSEEVSQIQSKNSGHAESLTDTKDYTTEGQSTSSRSLSSEGTMNGTKHSTRPGLPVAEDKMEDKVNYTSLDVSGRQESQRSQSLPNNSDYESEEDKMRLSTDDGDELVNISINEDCLQEQDRLSSWPPMGQRSISSYSPISSRRTSVFTEGEKSRSGTDDSDNVFDMKVRSTSMISTSKTSEENNESIQIPGMVSICLYVQVHSEDLVVIFLAEKSLGTDEDTVKKIRQTVCSQAAELETELKATENTTSKDKSGSPYNYMAYNSFEHSLTTKLEAQIPADDVKFFHGARMLHNEFNQDSDLTKVHLGSTNGTVVADQLPGSQEFYFMPSGDTGLSLAKTSPTKTHSKTKLPFGDAWSRR